MGRPPARDARDTRQNILDSALDLFAEKGFFGTSMREIARAVGVRESAIYHHFASKETLFDALMGEAGEERVHRFEKLMETLSGEPVRLLLQHLAEHMVAQWNEAREQKLWRILVSEGFRLAESGKVQMDGSFRKSRERLEALFGDLATQGRIKSVKPGIAAMEFIAPMLMVRNMSISPKGFQLPPGTTIRDIVVAHVAFFCDALGV